MGDLASVAVPSGLLLRQSAPRGPGSRRSLCSPSASSNRPRRSRSVGRDRIAHSCLFSARSSRHPAGRVAGEDEPSASAHGARERRYPSRGSPRPAARHSIRRHWTRPHVSRAAVTKLPSLSRAWQSSADRGTAKNTDTVLRKAFAPSAKGFRALRKGFCAFRKGLSRLRKGFCDFPSHRKPWCERRDSNPHAVKHRNLNPVDCE
jgi:hypothetical protein